MIQILDEDLPITVAQKIICGTKPYNPTPAMKAITKVITGSDTAGETQDMFSVEEIREIAEYLQVYCKNHEEGD